MVTMEQPCIFYGAVRIPFELRRKQKSSNRITIKVASDGQIIVSAPPNLPHEDILHAVNQRGQWIHHKLQLFAKQRDEQLPFEYVSGASLWYLGQIHLLQVTESPNGRAWVDWTPGQLQMTLDVQKESVRVVLLAWYRQQAVKLFNQRLDMLLPITPWVTFRPRLSLRCMTSRWGSCSVSGNISLNIHLIKAPLACIDYVILHELCHIAEHNHSTRFYRLMEHVCPDWKTRKAFLDQNTSSYL